MGIKISSFLHDSVKHPDKPELRGISIRFTDENNRTLKRTFGPYMTWDDYELTKTLNFPPGTSKQKIKEIFELKKKIETAEARGNEVKEALAKRDLLDLDNISLVIDPIIHFKLKVPIEKKIILSEPDQPFDANEAVAKIFLPAKSATKETTVTAEEVEIVEGSKPTTTALTRASKAKGAVSILNNLAAGNGGPLSTSAHGVVYFDSMDDLMQNHPEFARDAFFLAQFIDFIEMTPDGKYWLNIAKFNPKRNFLEYFLEALNKKDISINREKQMLGTRECFIEFLKKNKFLRKVDGKPYIAFASIKKALLKRLDKWMIDTKKYTRGTASNRLKDIRTIFHRAKDDKIINDNFHPFVGKNKFKVPSAPYVNRAVNPKDLPKLLAYRPCKVRNWVGNSEELFFDFWLMSSLAYGINQMDLLSLKKAQVEEGQFKFKRAKIEKRGGDALEITVIIVEPLKILMEKWKSKDPKSEYYFPFLDLTEADEIRLASVKEDPEHEIDLETAYRREFNQIISEKVNDFTRTMNRYLRAIGKKLKFVGDITSYSARHTFANTAIDKGIPPLRVMQSMGQKCFPSFMHYVNERMSVSEMKEMLDVIEEIHKNVTVVRAIPAEEAEEFEEFEEFEYEDDINVAA